MADELFADKQEIVASLSPDNFVINNGVLATAHSIFGR
jgi:exportin-2 (importin alpha re-exporter)